VKDDDANENRLDGGERLPRNADDAARQLPVSDDAVGDKHQEAGEGAVGDDQWLEIVEGCEEADEGDGVGSRLADERLPVDADSRFEELLGDLADSDDRLDDIPADGAVGDKPRIDNQADEGHGVGSRFDERPLADNRLEEGLLVDEDLAGSDDWLDDRVPAPRRLLQNELCKSLFDGQWLLDAV